MQCYLNCLRLLIMMQILICCILQYFIAFKQYPTIKYVVREVVYFNIAYHADATYRLLQVTWVICAILRVFYDGSRSASIAGFAGKQSFTTIKNFPTARNHIVASHSRLATANDLSAKLPSHITYLSRINLQNS